MFDLLNDQLIAELPQLLDLRVPFFDPSFEAMIRMQAKVAEEGYEKLSGVQRCAGRPSARAFFHSMDRYFGDNVRDDYAAGQLDAQVSANAFNAMAQKLKTAQVEGVLQEMRELSICGA